MFVICLKNNKTNIVKAWTKGKGEWKEIRSEYSKRSDVECPMKKLEFYFSAMQTGGI